MQVILGLVWTDGINRSALQRSGTVLLGTTSTLVNTARAIIIIIIIIIIIMIMIMIIMIIITLIIQKQMYKSL